MSKPDSAFEKLARRRAFRPLRPILHTVQGIVLGSSATTAGAPHFVDHIDIKRYMASVILALLPATVAAVRFFGGHAASMILVSYLTGGVIEVAFALIRKKEIEEGFLVTGLIFPLILPPTTPLWIVAVGVGFGVFFGKEVFGGTGRNIFNPALVGRLFITIAFPEIMSSSWRAPGSDAVTAATPLGLWKTTGALVPALDLLLGQTPGSMGELFRIGILAGGLFLMLARIADWRIPLSYLGSVFLLALAGHSLSPQLVAPPLFHLLSGGLLFGALFMATDPVTAPSTRSGKVVFGLGCGTLTFLIRSFSGFTEGVMFSIVLMNAFSPLIDTIVLSRRYKSLEPGR
jgi:Na+-transporting NADH:ubiquinone oxidoreductase subunit B/electron transport complex protein RnfD